jgi:cobalt-zinc-cadmium efflux system outer membrane protein
VTDEPALLRAAQARRPDVAAAAHAALAAQRGKELASLRRIPDVTLSMQVSGIGLGQQAASPAVLVLGASTNLPLFYQQEGEIKRAGAAVDVATLTHAKVQALVAADVAGSVATFRATRSLVERMETQLLPRARIARDVLAMQFHAGKAHLMDFLDAQRQYIATRLEYFDDLDAYWSAVFNVEQALGIEVTP